MKKNNLIIVAVITTFLISTSCSKYDEGPLISFRSKTDRLCQTWKPKKILINGAETILTPDQQKTTIEFKKDGDLYLTTYRLSIAFPLTGTWKFYDKDEKLILSIDKGDPEPQVDTVKILRLMKDELWLKQKKDNIKRFT